MKKTGIVVVIMMLQTVLFAQITPQEAIVAMGRGINLGNTLEPEYEGGWNNGPAEEFYFDMYADAGFSTVRVPVRWDKHTATATPYTVDETWMTRVETVIDWGLSRGLFVILNAHHEEWLKSSYTDENNARFDSIWSQIAERFKNKSEKLLFEIINEPLGLSRAQVDELNQRVLNIIRKTNPTRICIISGNQWSNSYDLMSITPPNDDYLIGYFHSYDPYDFGLNGYGTFGSDRSRSEISYKFETVKSWSDKKGIPVIISEFGAIRSGDYNSRMIHYKTFTEEALTHGMASAVWDDGGSFEILKRNNKTWNDIKDIVIYTNDSTPDYFEALYDQYSKNVHLSWVNRTALADSFHIERRAKFSYGTFDLIDAISGNNTTYTDSDIIEGSDYYYRIIGFIGDTCKLYSYPQHVNTTATERSPWNNVAADVPGIIEAENFDEGGYKLTYYDKDLENIPGYYRTNVGVDIESRNDGGFQLTKLDDFEWIEYTLNVTESGYYDVSILFTCVNDNSKVYITDKNGKRLTYMLTAGISCDTYDTVTNTIALYEGEQIFRLSIDDVKETFAIDKFIFTKTAPLAISDNTIDFCKVYPKLVQSIFFVETDKQDIDNVSIYNINGNLVKSENASRVVSGIDVSDLPSGIYTVVVSSQKQMYRTQIVKQ